MPLRIRACTRYAPSLHTYAAHAHVLHVLHVFSARPIILSHLITRNQAGGRTGMYHMYHLMVKKTGSVPSSFCCRCLSRLPGSRGRRRQGQTAITPIWTSLHRRLSLPCAESIYHDGVHAVRYCMRGGQGPSPGWACCGFRAVRFPAFGFFPSAQWAPGFPRFQKGGCQAGGV